MTPEIYLDRVRTLLPDIRERVESAEQLRRLPDETLKAFQEAGLFRAVQPKRYGGYELDLATFYQAVIEVGTVCASSAWILGVVGIHSWQMALFPAQAQEEVWGEDSSLQLSTSLAPTGHVERAGEGFRLHGRWSFSSGCDFCQWVLLSGAMPPAAEGGGAGAVDLFAAAPGLCDRRQLGCHRLVCFGEQGHRRRGRLGAAASGVFTSSSL